MMEIETVYRAGLIKRAVAALLKASAAFSVEPLPDNYWRVMCKEEHVRFLPDGHLYQRKAA